MNEQNLSQQQPKALDVRICPPPTDELTLQNTIRRLHKQDWPNVILQFTKRVQAVNQTWAGVVSKLMRIPGFRLSWYHDEDKDSLVMEISIKHPEKPGSVALEEVELHEITAKELQEAHQYIEVLLMDKVDHSELIARWIENETKHTQ